MPLTIHRRRIFGGGLARDHAGPVLHREHVHDDGHDLVDEAGRDHADAGRDDRYHADKPPVRASVHRVASHLDLRVRAYLGIGQQLVQLGEPVHITRRTAWQSAATGRTIRSLSAGGATRRGDLAAYPWIPRLTHGHGLCTGRPRRALIRRRCTLMRQPFPIGGGTAIGGWCGALTNHGYGTPIGRPLGRTDDRAMARSRRA